MAEVFFNQLADRHQLPAHAVSRGLSGFMAPASRKAIEAAAEYGCDLEGHLSACVTEEDLRFADHIFCMTKGHAVLLRAAFPEMAWKIETLTARDIPDPYGGSGEQYQQAAKEIYTAVKQIVLRLKEGTPVEFEYPADGPDASLGDRGP